jgi:hypothetical protein
MKYSCYFVFNYSVLLCLNLYSTNLYCLLGYYATCYNFSARTPQKTYVTSPTTSTLFRYQHWAWRGRHGKHKSRDSYPLLCDVTTYAEVCLPSRCLETGCITPLFYCCVRVLFSNGRFCGSTVLAWSKYGTIFWCLYATCLYLLS